MKELKQILAYRWFLGYSFHDKIPPSPRSGKI
ncbi:hypothetical protein [Peribacillus frigoritolerans]